MACGEIPYATEQGIFAAISSKSREFRAGNRAIRQIPPRQRAAISWHNLQGLTDEPTLALLWSTLRRRPVPRWSSLLKIISSLLLE